MSKDKISLIIPCHNEEEAIPLFYEETNSITKIMNNVDFEMIFINDGSKDKTLEVLRELSKKDKRVRYISFSRNFGKEAGMYAGLEASTGDFVAIMDADLQDPPKMLIEMYDTLCNEDYDCVALYTKSHKGYNILRKLGTLLWYKVYDVISDSNEMHGSRDFRLMTRQMVDSILEMKEYNRYTKGMFGFVGFNTKWISYDAPDRTTGESYYNFKRLIKYALEGVVTFSTKPLLLSAYVGMIFCILSFLAIIFIIVKTLVWGDPTSGWPSMVCIIIFVSGIQLFFLGIIGMYLSKIYLEVKQRPIYIVKETEKTKRRSFNAKKK